MNEDQGYKPSEDDVDRYINWQAHITAFIEDNWNLVPQPVKPEYADRVAFLIRTTWQEWEEAKKQFRPEWFEPFEKGRNVTWQQWLILLSIEKAIAKQASMRITVSSGHGIGKSALISWAILWYLGCHENAQVPATAPSADQMYDVLWKELSLWIGRMKPAM